MCARVLLSLQTEQDEKSLDLVVAIEARPLLHLLLCTLVGRRTLMLYDRG